MKNLNLVYKINATNHIIKIIFFQNITIHDMIHFIKIISCSEATHVSTKQRLALIYPGFQYLSKKNAISTQNFYFL